MLDDRVRVAIRVSGLVQGVGFRPFVHAEAGARGLSGWVRNSRGAVELEVEGAPGAVGSFVSALETAAPDAARVDAIEATPMAPGAADGFRILPSELAASGEDLEPHPRATTSHPALELPDEVSAVAVRRTGPVGHGRARNGTRQSSVLSLFFARDVARSTPIGPTGPVRLTATALTSSVISSAGWLVVARGWLEIFTRGSELASARVFLAVRPLIFGFGVLLYLLSLAISYLLAAFELSRQAERRGLEAQVHAREAELRSLRAQIDPHFLFNSLHSISALTTADPPAARRMCVLLGDFFRDSLALGSEDRITLTRELQLAERFLEIEQVRFGDRCESASRFPSMVACSCRRCCFNRSSRMRSRTGLLMSLTAD